MSLGGISRDDAFTGRVHVEILNPHLIALSVPKNQPGFYTPLEFQITITNNTSTSIFGTGVISLDSVLLLMSILVSGFCNRSNGECIN